MRKDFSISSHQNSNSSLCSLSAFTFNFLNSSRWMQILPVIVTVRPETQTLSQLTPMRECQQSTCEIRWNLARWHAWSHEDTGTFTLWTKIPGKKLCRPSLVDRLKLQWTLLIDGDHYRKLQPIQMQSCGAQSSWYIYKTTLAPKAQGTEWKRGQKY